MPRPDPGFDVEVLTRAVTPPRVAEFSIRPAENPADRDASRRLRRETFVEEQQLFVGDDHDDSDDHPATMTLLARTSDGAVVGTVRLAPEGPDDLGWWVGSRLAVRRSARGHELGIGSALVRAACAHAEAAGALRFDAHVQPQNAALFRRLGWTDLGEEIRYGHPHRLMTWPLDRIQRLVDHTKAVLGSVLAPFDDRRPGAGADGAVAGGALGGAGFRGDDGAPVPGSDLVAAADAILPSMVERDPEWAGWCSVLVNLNDLSAMGAAPVALLDTFGARDASFATRIVNGIAAASRAWGVPVIGGHTQLGVPAALSVTALGRSSAPVPAGGGSPGQTVTVTADLGGGWRRGYTGAQWDSTSHRSSAELQAMGSFVARTAPAAAKDVSMAGLVGTLGMLAEASGCGATLDVADIPRPAAASMGDWLTCFPGFAMITTDHAHPGQPDRGHPDHAHPNPGPAPAGPAVSRTCGELDTVPGVRLRWPDGRRTPALLPHVTGLGPA